MTARVMPIRQPARRLWAAALCALALSLVLVPVARAERTLLSANAVDPHNGEIEDACGIAIGAGHFYVSSYYRHQIFVYNYPSGLAESAISTNPLDSACGLAVSASGALYANTWHRGVERLRPSVASFDSAESTGVAVDQASGNVYVNDRTYVAVYEASGAPVLDGGQPLRIGLGSLGDGFGVAVAAGRVYVPDAADQTVKVYEPAVDPLAPVLVIDGGQTPQGGFNSLVDAAVAVDPTTGHLLVLDNLQPGFEHPEAAIEEFDATGAFLGEVSQRIIDGEPSGLAFGGGTLFVTSGNSEGGAVYKFGAYFPASLSAAAPAGADAVAAVATAQATASSAAVGAAVPAPSARRPARHWRHHRKARHRNHARAQGGRNR